MKDMTLQEMLKALRHSMDPYDRGMARGIEMAMNAYVRGNNEEKNSPSAGQSNRGK